jgi:hypothetical protein
MKLIGEAEYLDQETRRLTAEAREHEHRAKHWEIEYQRRGGATLT